MFPHRDSKLTRIALWIFFILIIGYGIYEAQGLLFGPKINVSTATTVVHEPYVKIEGQAKRIASLSMNGKEISVTENGSFSEPFLLASGENRIALQAKDTYGRVTSSYVDITFIPDSSTEAINETSKTQNSTTTPF
jgi:hypothetical protein